MIRASAADVVVLGAGPAGIAAACASIEARASTVVVERENRPGGILKQCVHDGFGLERYREKLTGPEYALRDLSRLSSLGGAARLDTFVSRIGKTASGFELACVDRGGVSRIEAKALVLATGCRERTDRQVFIHGDRPAGIYTAGLAQYMINVQGLLPGRRALILGSGDIGLIMARRMTLEGVEVLGAHEIKSEPSGLSRNVRQCLVDWGIPLELSSTVLEVHGRKRVERVTIARVGPDFIPIPGSERDVECDTLILSVGLIPENELAKALGVPIDPATRGPFVDQRMQTLVDGVFACGNAVHVNDLADYVSESGETAGASAAYYALSGSPRERGPTVQAQIDRGAERRAASARGLARVEAGPGLGYVVPQYIDLDALGAKGREAVFYFRSKRTILDGATLSMAAARAQASGGKAERRREAAVGGAASAAALFKRSYRAVRPPEMERVAVPWAALEQATEGGGVRFDLEPVRRP